MGFQINDVYINNLRYSDDTVLMVTNIVDLQWIQDLVRTASEEYYLNLNIRKNKL